VDKTNIYRNSKAKAIIVILLVQSFFTISIGVMSYVDVVEQWNNILLHLVLLVSFVLAILSIVFIQELYELAKSEVELEIKREQLEENKRLVKELRIKKHDFSNHLQTISGMLQLKKYQQANQYIKSLAKDVHKIERKKIDKNSTIFDSVLNYKKSVAIGRGLDFSYNFESGFSEIDLTLKDIFKILTNLVDNAIDAAAESDIENPKIIVKGKNEFDRYLLSVYNQGSYIEPAKKELIFQPGFSTKQKKKNNRGFGLDIIKSLIEDSNGKIEVISKLDYGTEFICYFFKS